MSHRETPEDSLFQQLAHLTDQMTRAASEAALNSARRVDVMCAVDRLERFGRACSSHATVSAAEFRQLANLIEGVLVAWGDAPPQFARVAVPEKVYARVQAMYDEVVERARVS